MGNVLSIEERNKKVLRDAKEGDLLKFKRKGGLYYHWAVYIGNGKVIERGSDEKKKSSVHIREVDFLHTAKKSKATIDNSMDSEFQKLDDSIVVKRAKSLLEKSEESGYDVFGKNCEHFALWCRYGLDNSVQANKIKNVLSGTGSCFETLTSVADIITSFV